VGLPGVDEIGFGFASHALAAAVFVAVAVLLLTRWRNAAAGTGLVPALLMSAAWAAMIAYEQRQQAALGGVFVLVEFLRDAAWLRMVMFFLPTGHPVKDGRLHLMRREFVVGIGGMAAAVGLSLLAENYLVRAVAVSTWRTILIAGGLTAAVAGLVVCEQAFRNARAPDRWVVKNVLLAAALVFTYDVCLYSTSFLAGGLSALLWEARGAVNLLLVPLLAIGASRLHRRGTPLTGAIGTTFYTTALVALGIYLIGTSLIAAWVRANGGSWSGPLQVLLLCAALLVLAVVWLSEQARAWFKVVVAKSFAPYRYDYRVEWLRLTTTLSTPAEGEALEDRAVRALTQVVHSPAGAVWVQEAAGVLVARGGELAPIGSAASLDACAWVRTIAEREWILDLKRSTPPWLEATDLSQSPLIQAGTWLVVPLLHGGKLTGVMTVAEPLVPSAELNWEDLDLLKTAARQVAGILELDRAARELTIASEFDAYNRLATFIMHDLKNVVAQQTLVIQNFGKHRSNPAFIDDAIATIEGSVKRMGRLLEQLRASNDRVPSNSRRCALEPLIAEAVHRCGDRRPVPVLAAPVDSAGEVLVDPERFAHALEHVIRNAQDAAGVGGAVHVEMRRMSRYVVVEVADDGQGMDGNFVRNGLFRPFQTSKGSQGMGIGAYQARECAIQSGGYVTVDSQPGRGTRFAMCLPLAAPPPAGSGAR
jgi:putative PEP-CTERM system histidine kinase